MNTNKESDKMGRFEGESAQELKGTTTSDVHTSETRSLQDMFTLLAVDLEKSLKDEDLTDYGNTAEVITVTRKSKGDDYFPRDEEFRKAWGIK